MRDFPLPVIIGAHEAALLPLPDLSTPFHMLIHEDMRQTSRVRAFSMLSCARLPWFVQCRKVERPALKALQNARDAAHAKST
jgi:hypothetical protein